MADWAGICEYERSVLSPVGVSQQKNNACAEEAEHTRACTPQAGGVAGTVLLTRLKSAVYLDPLGEPHGGGIESVVSVRWTNQQLSKEVCVARSRAESC